jgi:alkylhydroperoxidase family enzyme
MPRVEPLSPPYAEPVASELAAMMPPGMEPLLLFRTLARNPRVLSKIRAGNLLDRGSLDRRDRELVILRACARCGSEYEWGIHAALFARRFGLGDAEIAGTRLASGDDPLWSDRDRDLIRLVDGLRDHASVADALWRRLAAAWSPEQLIELIVLTGFYHTISFVTNGLALTLEPEAERFPRAGGGAGGVAAVGAADAPIAGGAPAQDVRQ